MLREKLRLSVIITTAVSIISSGTNYAITERDLFREIVVREFPVEVSEFRELCHEEKPGQLDDWCRGYIIGLVQGLGQKKDICVPKNSVGRINDVAVWTIVRAWISRQVAATKLTFSQCVVKALLESFPCQ